jgi:hypothetical protein
MRPGFLGDREELVRIEYTCFRVSELLARARRLEVEGYTATAEALRKNAADLLDELDLSSPAPPRPREPAPREA